MDIVTIRKSLNMSQREFSNEFEIPLRTLQEWEQGRQKPPIYLSSLILRIIKLENEKKRKERGF